MKPMKKRTLIAATALTLTCLGGQAVTAQAATGNNGITLPNGSRVIVGYGSGCNIEDIKDIANIGNIGVLGNCENLGNVGVIGNCENLGNIENIQDILNQFGDCFPDISLPDCELPEGNTPGNAPENTPGNTPENAPGSTPESNPGNGSTEESTPEDTPSEDDTPTDEDTTDSEHAFIKEVVNLVNAERAKEGLSPLSIDTKVQAAAMVRARECEKQFSHTRPDGSSFTTALKEQNVSYRSAGENIAWGQRSPEEVMNAWMNSSGHRANIMDPDFTTIGVGYYENAQGTGYWCQIFTR